MASPTPKQKPKTSKVQPATRAVPDLSAGAVAKRASDVSALDPDEIARLAYSYWEARGGQGGSAEEDWQRAEQELRSRS